MQDERILHPTYLSYFSDCRILNGCYLCMLYQNLRKLTEGYILPAGFTIYAVRHYLWGPPWISQLGRYHSVVTLDSLSNAGCLSSSPARAAFMSIVRCFSNLRMVVGFPRALPGQPIPM